MEEEIKNELAVLHNVENEVQVLTEQLATNPLFKQLMEARDKFNAMQNEVWKRAEDIMVMNDIKRISTDYMNLTIGKRIKLNIDEAELPKTFYKKVVDNKKIADTYKLTGKEPKGVSIGYTKYLIKKVK